MRYLAWGRRLLVVCAVVAVAAGCTGATPRRAAPDRAPTPADTGGAGDTSAAVSGPAPELRGVPLVGPVGLRALVDGNWYDLDTGAGRAAGVTGWLRPVVGSPVLVAEPQPSMDARPGPVTVSRTACTLREQDLDGRTRRAPRPVPCGVEPILETAAGLWVRRSVNVYSLAGRSVEVTEATYALLDPGRLRERASYAEAFVVGAHHAQTMDDQENSIVLRDLRTGSARPLTKPDQIFNSFFVANAESPLARVSPDGRYAVFRFGAYSGYPQIIDLWVLDLAAGAWQHVPGMSVYGSLKYPSEAWAPDGRLVMLGYFGVEKRLLATWRPGEAQVAVGPDPLPEALYDAGLGPMFIAGRA